MSHENHGMDRRAFIKAGALGGAAMALPTIAQASVPKDKQIATKAGALPERPFGKTGHTLPIFGHGGSAMFKGDIAYYGVPLLPLEERIKMVRHGYDNGIRYFDTARIYGESEEIMGKALGDVRDNVFLASKVLVMEVDRVRSSVERSLEALGTSYIDCMQIHGPVIERLGYDGCMPMYEELAKLRDEGMIRFIGITGHSRFDEMHKLIDSNHFDTLLIEYGYFHKGYNTRHTPESVALRAKCVDRAAELNMGIVAMKVFAAWVFNHNSKTLIPDFDEDKRTKLARAALRWVLNDNRVQVLNIGISMPSDIDTNIALLNGDTKLTEEDIQILEAFSQKAYLHPMVQELALA